MEGVKRSIWIVSVTLEISARQLARVTDAVVHFGRMHAHAMARPKQLLKASANAGRFPAGVSWTRDDTPANAHRIQVASCMPWPMACLHELDMDAILMWKRKEKSKLDER